MTEIVSAVQFKDYILIFMKNGDIWKMVMTEYDVPTYYKIDKFKPND